MSDPLAGVLTRINQIRSSMGGGGGVLGVQGAKGRFDLALRSASASATTAARGRTSSSDRAVSDPLERLTALGRSKTTVVDRGDRAEAGADWPEGVPEEARQYEQEFRAAAAATGVPLELLLAVAWTESGFNPDALSAAGAQGMMQLMPGTAAGLGVDPSDVGQNILGGARYLAAQYQSFGSWELALAAYNAGPGAVTQYGGVPPYAETQNYVDIVGSRLEQMAAATTTSVAPVLQRLAPTDATIDLTAGSAEVMAAAPGEVPAVTPVAVPADTPGGDTTQGRTMTNAGGAALSPANATTTTATAEAATEVLTTTPPAFPQQLLGHAQRAGQGSHRLNVRLDPPELGQVDVLFELRGDQVHVVIRPERAEGGTVLLQQRERIAELFAREGLELSSFDVGTNSSGSGNRQDTPSTPQPYGLVDLDLTTDVTFTVDRELRL